MTNTNSQDESITTPRDSFIDPLLECLVIITKLQGHPHSADSFKAGLPLKQNRLTPDVFERAAQRVNFNSRIVQRPLNELSNLLLPAILLLNNNQACVITQIHEDQTYSIILPENSQQEKRVTLLDLSHEYCGYAIFLHYTHHFDRRADEFKLEKPTSWFWGTIWRYRSNYYQVLAAALLINLFALASPLFVMNVYDRVVPNEAFETLWVLAIGISIVFIFDFLLRTLRSYLIDVSGKKADTLLATLIMQHVLNIRLEQKPISAGGFTNNLNGYEALRDFFTSATVVTLIDFPFIFLFLLFIGLIGGAVVIIPLLAVPLVIMAGFALEIPVRRAVEESFLGATQKHAILVETVTGLETIKAQGAESRIQRKWEQYVGIVARSGLKSRFFSQLALNITTYIMQMVTVGTVVLGVYLISAGKLSMGGLIACTILSGRALAPLSQIASIITRFQQSKMGLQGLNRVMSLNVERPDGSQFLHRPNLSGAIEFRQVSFNYPDRKLAAVEDISFRIQAHDRVAILGRIGSGKSTILKLIQGLYQAQNGNIRFDGTDIGQIDPADLRRNIGYVSQDSLLFFGSIRENIALAAPWADDAAILQAAKLAGVDNFVRRNPNGYDMIIGERGEGLSGGQRQTIAIARAIVANPPILCFDEPTSAMDNSSEQEFLRNMLQFCQDKTLLLVTHKPHMLALVNRVIIVDNGKIVADGPKDQVLTALAQNKIKAVDV
ncbi:MAG: type I secretion system permease/ATPase [Legionellales bacterium]|nr:type I secretion system permease/ATPase [Legionellales bacterium]